MGSKSGLSYSDAFFIRTRYNGLEYHYMLRKGENGPRLDIIQDATPTTERNGTEIKIYMEDSNDIFLFKKECKLQLAYFDNVYFSEGCDISNTFEIIKGDNWIATTGEVPFNQLHLCIGKVAYPLDYKIMELSYSNLPCALLFDIGELDIIQTREDVKYTPKTKEAIRKKIEAFQQELIDRWQQVPKECSTLREFYDKKANVPNLEFANGCIKFLLNDPFIGLKHNDYYFKPFKDAGIFSQNLSNSYQDLFFEYRIAGHFTERFQSVDYSLGYYLDRSKHELWRITGDSDAKKNRYIQKEYGISTLYFVRKKKFVSLKTYKEKLQLKNTHKSTWRAQITAFQKELQKIVIASTTSYEKEVISQEYLDSIKVVRKSRDMSVVNVKHFAWSVHNLYYPTGNNSTFKKTISDLEDRTDLLLVGTEDDRNILARLQVVYSLLLNTRTEHLEIAPTNLKKITFQNSITVDSFMKGDTKEFRSIMSAFKMYRTYSSELTFIRGMLTDSNKLDTIQGVSPRLYETLTKRQGVVKNMKDLEDADRRWKNQKFLSETCYQLAVDNDLWDLELEADIKELVTYFKAVKIIDLFNYGKIIYGNHRRGEKNQNPMIEVVADYCYTQSLVNPNFPNVPLSIHWKMYFRDKYGKLKNVKAVEKQQVKKEIENLLV